MDILWEVAKDLETAIFTTKDTSIALANWLSLIVTAIACCFAWRAYLQSKKTRRSAAFSMLFAQLMANHRAVFGNEELKHTTLRPNSECNKFSIDENDDVFINFTKYYLSKHESICKRGENSELTYELIDKTWADYVNSIKEESEFSHCFKYVYHEIRTVMYENNGYSLDDNDWIHYMGVIQANMNYDELFCYFINLLQHFGRIANKREIYNDWKKEDLVFLDGLKKSCFFNNLQERHDSKYLSAMKDLKKYGDSLVKELTNKIIEIQS